MKVSLIVIVIIIAVQSLLCEPAFHTEEVSFSFFNEENRKSGLDGFSLTIYGGRYTDRHLAEKVLMLKPIYYEDSWLKTLAINRQVFERNQYYAFEIEAQICNHVGEQKHSEYNFVAIFRWIRLPVRGTLAVGNGVSYASKIPVIEDRSRTNKNASKLLNYLVLEATYSLFNDADWELVGRIHHRSGVFGLYNGVRGGSNVMAAGIRFFL